MTTKPRCDFRADLIVPNGGGWKRIPSQQCIARVEHWDEHASFEKGKWVARR